jgi:NADH dehydrogenase FAD-containing subunit
MKTVVIVGGSFAGLCTAHRILKQATKTGLSVKVVVVSPNSHFYWNVAAPRALLPGQIADDKIFKSIAEGFKQYLASQFEFVLGSAKSLDVAARKVEISTGPGGNGATTSLDYDFLILATGSRTKEGSDGVQMPYKNVGSTEETKDALHELQEAVKRSKTIVIAGGGPTGVETAGEIAFEYGRAKKVILVSFYSFPFPLLHRKSNKFDFLTGEQVASGQTVLDGAMTSVSNSAISILKDLKVDLRLQTKVSSSRQVTPDGPQELILSDGSHLTADLYIPTHGITPNSSYIPSQYLNADGFVVVNDHLKIKGLENEPVWAIGDVSDREAPQFMFVDRQSNHVVKSLFLALEKKDPVPYKMGFTGMLFIFFLYPISVPGLDLSRFFNHVAYSMSCRNGSSNR